MTKGRLVLAGLLLGWAGCSSSNLVGPDGAATSPAATACRWPAALDGADGRNACIPSRTQVSCHDPRGNGCGCTTDGGIACDCSALSGGGPWTCVSTCAANQYVVACGGIGAGAVPAPPAGCSLAASVPGGFAYYCCPCG